MYYGKYDVLIWNYTVAIVGFLCLYCAGSNVSAEASIVQSSADGQKLVARLRRSLQDGGTMTHPQVPESQLQSSRNGPHCGYGKCQGKNMFNCDYGFGGCEPVCCLCDRESTTEKDYLSFCISQPINWEWWTCSNGTIRYFCRAMYGKCSQAEWPATTTEAPRTTTEPRSTLNVTNVISYVTITDNITELNLTSLSSSTESTATSSGDHGSQLFVILTPSLVGLVAIIALITCVVCVVKKCRNTDKDSKKELQIEPPESGTDKRPLLQESSGSSVSSGTPQDSGFDDEKIEILDSDPEVWKQRKPSPYFDENRVEVPVTKRVPSWDKVVEYDDDEHFQRPPLDSHQQDLLSPSHRLPHGNSFIVAVDVHQSESPSMEQLPWQPQELPEPHFTASAADDTIRDSVDVTKATSCDDTEIIEDSGYCGEIVHSNECESPWIKRDSAEIPPTTANTDDKLPSLDTRSSQSNHGNKSDSKSTKSIGNHEYGPLASTCSPVTSQSAVSKNNASWDSSTKSPPTDSNHIEMVSMTTQKEQLIVIETPTGHEAVQENNQMRLKIAPYPPYEGETVKFTFEPKQDIGVIKSILWSQVTSHVTRVEESGEPLLTFQGFQCEIPNIRLHHHGNYHCQAQVQPHHGDGFCVSGQIYLDVLQGERVSSKKKGKKNSKVDRQNLNTTTQVSTTQDDSNDPNQLSVVRTETGSIGVYESKKCKLEVSPYPLIQGQHERVTFHCTTKDGVQPIDVEMSVQVKDPDTQQVVRRHFRGTKFTLPPFTRSDTGSYKIIITQRDGYSLYDTVNIQVHECSQTIEELMNEQGLMTEVNMLISSCKDSVRLFGGHLGIRDVVLTYFLETSPKYAAREVLNKVRSEKPRMKVVKIVDALIHAKLWDVVEEIQKWHKECDACQLFRDIHDPTI